MTVDSHPDDRRRALASPKSASLFPADDVVLAKIAAASDQHRFTEKEKPSMNKTASRTCNGTLWMCNLFCATGPNACNKISREQDLHYSWIIRLLLKKQFSFIANYEKIFCISSMRSWFALPIALSQFKM